MDQKYFVVSSINLAKAMKFLGFEYYVFDDIETGKIYSFVNNEKFQSAYREVCELRSKYKK